MDMTHPVFTDMTHLVFMLMAHPWGVEKLGE